MSRQHASQPASNGGALRAALDRGDREANQAQIGLFCGILAVAVAAIGYLLRDGFADNSPWEWAKYVGLSWFLVHFSLVARKVGPLISTRQGSPWWMSHAVLTLAAIVFTAIVGVGGSAWQPAGFDPALFTRGLAALVCLVGTAGFVLAIAVTFRARGLWRSLLLLIFAGLFALYAAGGAWGEGLQNPLFVEDLCFGRGPIDTLFHASISNMLRTYGVVSTGLDGLPYKPYHFGSHWLFARLTNLLHVRVIDFYNRGYAVVFVPLGVFSLGTFAISLSEKWRGTAHFPNAEKPDEAEIAPRAIGPAFWFVLAIGYVGFLPYAADFMPTPGLNSIILSESYAVAVAVSLLTIAGIFAFLGDVFAAGSVRWGRLVLGAVLLALLIVAIGLLKISVILVLAAAGAYLFLRLGLYRSPFLIAVTAMVALATWLAYRITFDPGAVEMGQSRLVPFGFPRTTVQPQWWADYWFIYYAWVWAFAAVRLRSERIFTLGDLARAWRERKLLDLELLIVAAAAGAGPGMLMTYSSTHYFSNYQQWLALGLLLAVLLRRPVPWPSGNGLTLGRIFAGLMIVSLVGTALSNTLVLLNGMVATNLAARGHAAGQTGFGTALMHGDWKKAAGILRETAAGTQSRLRSDKLIVAVLSSLDELPLAEKRRSLLFIPKSNRPYWDLLHGPYWPKEGTFVGPALSGIAMIDGLYVPAKDDPWTGHGYNNYSKAAASRPQPPLPQYVPTLRRRAAQMGFSQLIVIESGPGDKETIRKYDCP